MIKKYINLALLASLFLASCEKALDINKNPNSATYSTPQLVLPAAIASTTSALVSLHDYGSWAVGYHANAGGYGGWGDTFTYNYTSNSNTGLFTSPYLNLKNYEYIINSTANDPDKVLFNAVAKILKVFSLQPVVDLYGNVPYTEAGKGADFTTPKYDNAEEIYKDFVAQLDGAIAQLKPNVSNTAITALGNSDPIFKGNVTKWIQLANNIKLRILIRAQNSNLTSFVNSAFATFSSEGFLLEDAISNPGYNTTAAQNPYWGTYHSSLAGSALAAGRSRIPSTFVFSFYNGTKLSDSKRGSLTYKNFPSTPHNQLGNEQNPPTAIASYTAWYIGVGTGTSSPNALGILKGRTAGVPIFLQAEIYFLLAEAALKGHVLNGTAKAAFENGITASFRYLEKDVTNSVPSDQNPVTDFANYKSANTSSYLVNYDVATTDAQRLEAIITQKYLALNYIHGHEAWAEYRRTGYPSISGTVASSTFASILSQSSRADKLPVRLLYPQSEYNLNQNTPSGLNPFTSRIFWDAN